MNIKRVAVWVVLIAIFMVIPLVVSGYWLRLLTSVFMFGILAEAINIIAGFAGYPALGNVVFFGSGAYILGILMTQGKLSFALALIIAGIVSAAYAALIGLFVLRLSGRYFLMATIGLMGLTREIVTNLNITGGGHGLSLPMMSGSPTFIYSYFYYLMFGIMFVSIVVTYLISNNRIGFALRAINFDEDAAGIMGIPAKRYKIAAWAISAFFTGLAGGVFAYWMTYIEPAAVFDIATTVKMYLMFVFGGAGTIWGPIVGAFLIEVVSELVWSRFLDIHLLVMGLVIILVVMFMPKGMTGLFERYSLLNLLKKLTRLNVKVQKGLEK